MNLAPAGRDVLCVFGYLSSGKSGEGARSSLQECDERVGEEERAVDGVGTGALVRRLGASREVQCRILTARAMTRSDVRSAATLCTLINSLARVDSGMVSVGLKAAELVTETYR